MKKKIKNETNKAQHEKVNKNIALNSHVGHVYVYSYYCLLLRDSDTQVIRILAVLKQGI
jgi:hypothetical protein